MKKMKKIDPTLNLFSLLIYCYAPPASAKICPERDALQQEGRALDEQRANNLLILSFCTCFLLAIILSFCTVLLCSPPRCAVAEHGH